jgi:hypothetical protein
MRKVCIYHWGNQSRSPKKKRKYNYQAKHYKETNNGNTNTTQPGMKLDGIKFCMYHIPHRGIYVDKMLTEGNMSVLY